MSVHFYRQVFGRGRLSPKNPMAVRSLRKAGMRDTDETIVGVDMCPYERMLIRLSGYRPLRRPGSLLALGRVRKSVG